MPAARGVKRTAKAEGQPSAGSSKIKKKAGAGAGAAAASEELHAPARLGQVFTCGQGDVGQLGLGEDFLEKSRFTHVGNLPSNIVDICAGGMHTVCIDADGNVWTFGCNDEGALGRDTGSGGEWAPTKVALPGRAVSISAGDSHTAALLQSAQVYAWGSFRDSHGNMGLTLKGNEPSPLEMLPGHRVLQIASGGDHLVMLTDQGQVFTCGCGEQGQLGRVTARSCDRHSRVGLNGLLVPAPLVFGKDKADFDAVWAGTHCTFARKAGKGDIYVWGLNNYQQIGVRKGKPQTVFAPVKSEAFMLAGGTGWAEVAGGPHHSMALDHKGACHVLGRREYGRLGLGEACEDALELTPVPCLQDKKCVKIACGTAASFAVTDKGEVYAWGMGSSGQLGTGSEQDEAEPRLLSSKQLEGRTAISVSAGGQHTVLLVASPEENDDKASVASKADTAPQTKAQDKQEDQPMEVGAAEDKEPPKEEKVAPKKAAKRGRKASSSSVESTTKVSKTKQNGGLSPTAEKPEEAPEDTSKAADRGEQNPPEEAVEAEKESTKRPSEDTEEPSCKRAKIDEEQLDAPKPEDNNTAEEKEGLKKQALNDEEKMAVDEEAIVVQKETIQEIIEAKQPEEDKNVKVDLVRKLSNGEEIKADVEMTTVEAPVSAS